MGVDVVQVDGAPTSALTANYLASEFTRYRVIYGKGCAMEVSSDRRYCAPLFGS